MESIVSIIVTVLCSVIASSGLAHDRIVSLGMVYIERGWITKDEYENLRDYLYEPYKALGGNGSAKRVMEGVNRLKIFTVPPITEGESQNEVNK